MPMAVIQPEKNLQNIALILAGYNRVSNRVRKKMVREIKEGYDGDEIYMGENKFLYELAGHPIIKYVIDAVTGARKNGKKLYDEVHIYNDIKSFSERINVKAYPAVRLHQMKDSVAGHWKDFYFNHIGYGQKVDVFFGDTPRITCEDVEHVHGEYAKILGNQKDTRGKMIYLVYGVVGFDDMKDNWLEHRVKYVKVGQNRGKLRSYVSFEDFQARIGNTGAFLKNIILDPVIDTKAVDFVYNIRKMLAPTAFSRVMYYLWKMKHMNIVKQIKNRSINLNDFYNCIFDVLSKMSGVDLRECGGTMYRIKKNAARWENDIDGPKDFEIFQRRFRDPAGADKG